MRLVMENQGKKADGGAWEIAVVETLADVEKLRRSWVHLQALEPFGNVNADIDRYVSVVASLGDASRPYVVVLSRGGVPGAMLVGRIEERRFRIAIGYRTLFRPALRCLAVIHGGILGRPGEDAVRELLAHLKSVLAMRKVDAVFLNHLETDSLMYRLASRMFGPLRCDHFADVEPHWVMSLPDSMEDFYKSLSKANRKSTRRAVRSLEKAYPGRVEYVCLSREDDLPEIFSALKDISSKTYQYAMGVGFVDSPIERERLQDAARQGWLNVHLLRIEGRPVAFELALQYEGTYFLYASGYDPDLRHLSPGKVLFVRLIEDLCKRRPVQRLDFGFGDAEYKRVYCNSHRDEASVNLFAARMKPLCINLLRTSATGISRGMRYVVGKLRLGRRIKRGWRDRFREKYVGQSPGNARRDVGGRQRRPRRG